MIYPSYKMLIEPASNASVPFAIVILICVNALANVIEPPPNKQ